MEKKDNDFLFENNIVFKSDDEKENPHMVKTLIKGVFKKEFSFKAFISLVSAFIKSNKIKTHYLKYPSDPSGYEKWVKKADRLWKKAGSMADNIKDA